MINEGLLSLMYHLTWKSVNVKDIFMVFSKENLIFWAGESKGYVLV